MIRNLVTFALSPFRAGLTPVTYQSEDGFSAACTQTTETGLKYIIWKLAQQGEKVDAVYPFVTEGVEKDGGFEKFQALFATEDFPFIKVPLAEDGQFKSVVPSLIAMFDLVKEFLQYHPDDTVRMHVDMTGGQRHIPMVMMTLLKMLNYQGVDMGLVIYTDFGHHQVEDASQLLSLFNLVSGADEFTSYGSTRGLQEYFEAQDHPSGELNFLLRRMNQVADTIRLCSNYEGMEDALRELAGAIQRYETYAAGKKISPQDKLFSKLLPQVEKEYSQILPLNEEINPADIITWCAEKGFLQQGMTFYTEWMPRYLVQAGFVTIRDPQITLKCKQKGKMWSSWEIYFFKDYLPEQEDWDDDDEEDSEDGELTYKRLRKILADGSLTKISEKVKGKNDKIDELFAEARIVQTFDEKRAVSYIVNLPKASPLSVFFHLYCPSTAPSYVEFIRTRFRNEKGSISEILKKGIPALGRDKMLDNYQLSAGLESKKNKPEQRRQVFQWLFKEHKISSTLRQEEIIDFASNYTQLVSQWRNAFNHANVHDTSSEANEEIQDLLIQNVAFLTHTAQ